MRRPLFTPEELAELAAFDAEVDAAPAYDPEEVKAQRRRDTEMRWDGLDNKERAAAEKKRAYREANRDTIAEKRRDKYHETTSDQNAETSPLRQWRRINRMSQKDAGLLFGISQQQISLYERGFTPMPANVMEAIGYAQ